METSFVQMRVDVNVILDKFLSKSATYNFLLPTKNAPDKRKRLCFSLDLEIQKQFRIHRRIVLVNFIVKMRSG